MKQNINGLIKAAEDTSVSSLLLSAAPALFGALGGGGLGYLSGKDEDEEGNGGTRLRNAIIGAGLGGLGGGAISNELAKTILERSPLDNRAEWAKRGGLVGLMSTLAPTATLGGLGGSLLSLKLTKDKQKNGLNNAIAGALAGLGLGAFGNYNSIFGTALLHENPDLLKEKK